MGRHQNAFTLIELLVVIAIMAILAAIMMPAVIATNARARTITCESRLQEIGLALRMYVEDYGAYPADLQRLCAGRYVDDPEALRCVKTGHVFLYRPPGADGPPSSVLAACADPHTPPGRRPHDAGSSLAVLLLNGKTRVVRE